MLFDHNQSGTDCGLYFENDIFPLNKGSIGVQGVQTRLKRNVRFESK